MNASNTARAVLLAAGIGSRLGGVPKALLTVNGSTLLDRCAAALADVGATEMTIVTGFGAEEIRRHCAETALPVAVRFIHNDAFDRYNNFHTVDLAARALPPGDMTVINSDILFSTDILRALLAERVGLRVVVEPGWVDDEALKVEVEDGRVVSLGKGIPPPRAHGEFIGLSTLDDEARRRYSELSATHMASGAHALYYEDVYSLLARESPAAMVHAEPGTWAEIDTPDDHRRAEVIAIGLDDGVGPR